MTKLCKNTIQAAYPVLLFKFKLLNPLLQGFLGLDDVVRRPLDGDDIGVVLLGRNDDAHVKLLHHAAHVLALLPDDEAMQIVWHFHCFGNGNKVLEGKIYIDLGFVK